MSLQCNEGIYIFANVSSVFRLEVCDWASYLWNGVGGSVFTVTPPSPSRSCKIRYDPSVFQGKQPEPASKKHIFVVNNLENNFMIFFWLCWFTRISLCKTKLESSSNLHLFTYEITDTIFSTFDFCTKQFLMGWYELIGSTSPIGSTLLFSVLNLNQSIVSF